MEETPNIRLFVWGITDRCNLTCPHCYSAVQTVTPDELSTAEARALIDDLGALHFNVIGWTGGEPLLRRDLEELIAYAKDKYQIRSGITTNGVLLSAERAASLKAAGVSAMQVSIDGASPETNRRMRLATEAQFQKAVEGVRASKNAGIKTHMAMVLGQENLDEAPAYREFALSLGADSIRFCGFVPWGGGNLDPVKERLEFNSRLGDLARTVEEMQSWDEPIVMFDPGFGPTPPHYCFHECIAGIDTCYLSANGDLYPCTALLDKQFLVGNVRRTPFLVLWNDPQMRRIAEYDRSSIHGPCRGCDMFDECRGACRGVTFAHTGDLDASFPVCLKRV
jgi:AdoMet-dependent heme synthase